MEYNFDLISKYHSFKKIGNENEYISEKIAEDIEIDMVFLNLDFTKSKIGKQFLFSKLRSNGKPDEKLLEYSQNFDSKPEDRIFAEKELSKLNEKKDYYLIDLLTETVTPNQNYYNYARLSLFALALILILSFFYVKILLALILLFAANLVIHYLNKNYVEFYNSVIYRLQNLLKISAKLSKVSFLRGDYSRIDLRILNKNMRSVGFDTALSKNEYLSVLWFFIEIFRVCFMTEIFSFRRKIRALDTSKPQLLEIIEFIGRVDCAIALNEIKRRKKTCQPDFIYEKKIILEGIYNPFIENCVENSLDLNAKSAAITGTNMSGKTSFMRTVAINTLFAQNFGFCFAEKYTAPKMQIYSSIAVHDSLSEGRSYYMEEVLRIKEFLKDSEEFKLILIDEIFKGTNTTERIAISKAVLRNLNAPKNIVFVTTHDLEIAEFLSDKGYDLFYFDENVVENELSFSYKIKSGINTKTNAVRILEMSGYPENILSEARKYL